jgi:hypothetical protein
MSGGLTACLRNLQEFTKHGIEEGHVMQTRLSCPQPNSTQVGQLTQASNGDFRE